MTNIENLTSEQLFALAKQREQEEKKAKEKYYVAKVDIYDSESLLDEVKYDLRDQYTYIENIISQLNVCKKAHLIFVKGEDIVYSDAYFRTKDGKRCYYDNLDMVLLEEVKKEQ